MIKELNKVRFSGILECTVKDNSSDLTTSYLTRLGTNLKYRRRRNGFYAFKGGLVQPFQINLKNTLNKLTLKFKESKLYFIDRMVEAATKDSDNCKLTYSIRWKNLENKSCSPEKREDNVMVVTYPKIGLLTVRGVFCKNSSKPGEMLEKIFGGLC